MFIFQFEKIKNLKENLMNIEILRLNQINNQIKQNTQKLSDLNDQIKVLQKRFDNQIQIKLDFNILTYIAECHNGFRIWNKKYSKDNRKPKSWEK